MIKTTASPSEIMAWKNDKRVAECYENLFKPMSSNKKKLFLIRIVDEVFSSENPSNVQIAFAIAICTGVLNPKYEGIKLNDNIMKRKVAHFLVGFCNFVNWDIQIILFTNFYFLKNKLDNNEQIGPDDDIEGEEEDHSNQDEAEDYLD